MVSSDKGALSRLIRAPNEFLREELLQRRVKFCLWVSFPIGRHEKPWVVLFTGMAPENIFSIVKQKVPFTVVRQLGLQSLIDQFDKIGILGRLTRINRQGWKKKENE